MNLVRLGHYFTPVSTDPEPIAGACRTALVIGPKDVHEKVTVDVPESGITVNLTLWHYDGGNEYRRGVPVMLPTHTQDSFHLSGDCPWKR